MRRLFVISSNYDDLLLKVPVDFISDFCKDCKNCSHIVQDDIDMYICHDSSIAKYGYTYCDKYPLRVMYHKKFEELYNGQVNEK